MPGLQLVGTTPFLRGRGAAPGAGTGCAWLPECGAEMWLPPKLFIREPLSSRCTGAVVSLASNTLILPPKPCVCVSLIKICNT